MSDAMSKIWIAINPVLDERDKNFCMYGVFSQVDFLGFPAKVGLSKKRLCSGKLRKVYVPEDDVQDTVRRLRRIGEDMLVVSRNREYAKRKRNEWLQ